MKKIIFFILMIAGISGYSQIAEPTNWDRKQYGSNWIFEYDTVRINRLTVDNKFGVDSTGNIFFYNNAAPAAGLLLQGNGSKFTGLTLGTAYQLLRVNAGATAAEWATPGATSPLSYSSGTFSLPITDNYVVVGTGASVEGDANLQWNGTKLSISGVDAMTVNGSAISTLFQAHGQGGLTATEAELHRHSATAGAGASLYFARSEGSEASPSAVSASDVIMNLSGVGYDGTDYATSAQIQFIVDGTPGSNDMPGGILFYTSPDGSQTLAQRMKISSAGNVSMGGSNTENYNLHVEEQARVEIVGTSYSSSATILAIRRANGTFASPTAILNTETVGSLSWGGYKASAFSTSSVAEISAVATEDYDDSGTGTKLNFRTTPNNTTGVVTQFTIDQDGTTTFENQCVEYNNITLANNGLVSSVGTPVHLTGQTAAIAATTCYTADEDGFYEVNWSAAITTAATTSSTLGHFQVRYTNVADNVVKTSPTQNNVTASAANATTGTGSSINGTFTVYAKSGTNIQYIMGYASSGATAMQYSLDITVKKL